MSLSSIYTEVEFSAALADNLDALDIGEFEDVETESNINRRRADIVAVGSFFSGQTSWKSQNIARRS